MVHPPDINPDIGSLLDTFVESFVLTGVVVAAASGNEQNLERFGRGPLFALGEEQRKPEQHSAGREGGGQNSFDGHDSGKEEWGE